MVAIRNVSNSAILISGNLFTNLSIAGPLIMFREKPDYFTSSIALVNNNFTLITSYINSNILSV